MRRSLVLLGLASAISYLAPSPSAHAMEVFCNVVEVGIHDGNTPNERVVARCASATGGVNWLSVSTRNERLADVFFKTALAALESGRRLYSWAPSVGDGCTNNCRLATSAVLQK